jgi:hypothetical protein
MSTPQSKCTVGKKVKALEKQERETKSKLHAAQHQMNGNQPPKQNDTSSISRFGSGAGCGCYSGSGSGSASGFTSFYDIDEPLGDTDIMK